MPDYARGAILSPPDDRDFPITAAQFPAASAPLPAAVDLRGGASPTRSKPVGLPFDQLAFGSCTANAHAMLLMALRRGRGLSYTPRSRAFLYYEARLREGTADQDSGSAPRDALDALVKQGCPSERQEPYGRTPTFYRDPPTARDLALAAQARIGSYHQVQSEQDAMIALAAGSPVTIVIDGGAVAFQGVGADGVLSAEALAGRDYDHCVCFVGYDPNYWILMNSWSEQWGDRGFAYVPRSAQPFDSGYIAEAWAGALV